MNELWELVLANSLSGIHKFKVVCSFYRFVEILIIKLRWSSDKLPAPDAGGLSSKPEYFLMRASLEA